MFIRHDLPINGWTKIDRNVFTLDISAGAKVLYGYLCGLQNGANLSKEKMADKLKITPRTLTNYEKELKKANLLLIEQVSPRNWVAYIGHTRRLAVQVRNEWQEFDE